MLLICVFQSLVLSQIFFNHKFASIAILGLAQDSAHEASTKAPKSLIARARKLFTRKYLFASFIGPSTIIETRRTYRAVLSEPRLVVPYSDLPTHTTHGITEETSQSAGSTFNPIIVPQKRIRDINVSELNDPPTQGFGSSQKKKRKKSLKGEETMNVM
jgi:ribonuclease P/MRP protein subunit RPP1